MEKEAILILTAMVLLGYPLCYLALFIAARVTDHWRIEPRRVAVATIGLWVLTSLIDYGFIHAMNLDNVEILAFLILLCVWAALLLIISVIYVAVFIKRIGPQRFGLIFMAMVSGATLLLVTKLVAGGALVSIASIIGRVEHREAMDEYHTERIAETGSELAVDGIPLPVGVTELIGDGVNTSFAVIEQHPDTTAVNPDDWHVHYPPEKLYMLRSTASPEEIESALVDDLRSAGYSVYYHANQPGSGMQCAPGPFIAGHREGVFVQYKIDLIPAGVPAPDHIVWQKVWHRYSADIHALALRRMQPHTQGYQRYDIRVQGQTPCLPHCCPKQNEATAKT